MITFLIVAALAIIGDLYAWFRSAPTCYESIYYILPLGGYVALINRWRKS